MMGDENDFENGKTSSIVTPNYINEPSSKIKEKIPAISLTRFLLLGVIFLIVILLSGGIYALRLAITEESSPISRLPPDLSGTLFLTLRKSSDPLFIAGLYQVNLAELKTGGESFPQVMLDNGFVNITLAKDPSSRRGIYASYTGTERPGITQLYLIDLDTKQTKQLSNSPTFRKRNPVWAPDAHLVAFMAQPLASDGPLADANQYSVYVINLSGEEQLIDSGSHPHWVSSDELVYLKNDGLYVKDISDQESVPTKIWDVKNGIAYSNMKLEISDNRDQLAWSFPEEKRIIIFNNVSSWNPLSFEEAKTLSTYGFWTSFSEDGQYIAVQEGVEVEQKTEGRISIYNTHSLIGGPVLELADFDHEQMFLSDWVEYGVE